MLTRNACKIYTTLALLTTLMCGACSHAPTLIATKTESFVVPSPPPVNSVPAKGPLALTVWDSCLNSPECLSILQTLSGSTTGSSQPAAPSAPL